ncbi:hypothetical protein DBX26_11530 [Vibrio sp. dhg]|nr:hypothetical protein DBX26_11530 [Vibrio sp. dhg]
MTSLLMKSTSADKDTLHEQDQPLKKLAYVSNHRGPLLRTPSACLSSGACSLYIQTDLPRFTYLNSTILGWMLIAVFNLIVL